MIYGTKIVYRYNEEIPKVNHLGETLRDDNGDFLTENKEYKIELCFTAQTYIIYKNFTTRELLVDCIKAGKSADKEYSSKKETIERLKYKTEELTEDEIKEISTLSFYEIKEFMQDCVVAMIATNEYPKKRSYEEIKEELPDGIFEEQGFLDEVWALLQFGIKKKVNQMQKANQM